MGWLAYYTASTNLNKDLLKPLIHNMIHAVDVEEEYVDPIKYSIEPVSDGTFTVRFNTSIKHGYYDIKRFVEVVVKAAELSEMKLTEVKGKMVSEFDGCGWENYTYPSGENIIDNSYLDDEYSVHNPKDGSSDLKWYNLKWNTCKKIGCKFGQSQEN